jgi:hypothetical protein
MNDLERINAKLGEIQKQLDRIEVQIGRAVGLLLGLKKGQDAMALDFTQLQAEVANNTTVEGSAVTLIQQIAAEIASAGTDQATLDALVASLKANDTALAAAVVANTPAAPPAPTAA